MGDVIDFQKYKDQEEIAITTATKVVQELSGEIDEKEVKKIFSKVPTRYLSRILYALDHVIMHDNLDDVSMRDTEVFSDALADIVATNIEKLGVIITDEEE